MALLYRVQYHKGIAYNSTGNRYNDAIVQYIDYRGVPRLAIGIAGVIAVIHYCSLSCKASEVLYTCYGPSLSLYCLSIP